jgi:signal transduction histidine kinase
MSISPLPRWQGFNLSPQSAVGLLLLMAIGYLGNYWRWSFFFNIDFLFGSIAVWIVVCLYGTTWGAIAAFVASLCTFFIWHHPFSIITFTCEAIWVGLFFDRRRHNIVLLDAIFWFVVGMPLVLLFYRQIMQVEPVQVNIVLLKQAVNGIFNALIASLMLTHLPIHRWVKRPQSISTLSFQQTLLNLLVAFVFFPTLLLITFESWGVMDSIRMTSLAALNIASGNLSVEVQAWQDQRLEAVTELAQLAAQSPLTAPSLQQSLNLTQKIFADFRRLLIIDPTGKVLLASPTTAVSTTSATQAIAPLVPAEISQWRTLPKPQLSRVIQGPEDAQSRRLWLSAPIIDEELSGFVVAEVDPEIGVGALIKSHIGQQKLQITLVDKTQTIVATTSEQGVDFPWPDRHQSDQVKPLEANSYQWFPVNRGPAMARWGGSYFVQETAIAPDLPWTLVVELPAKDQVHYIEAAHTKNLSVLLLISGTGLFFATLLSRRLVQPLAKLTQVTTNLPHKLLDQDFVVRWPRSSVTELNSLMSNFQLMAGSLTQKFAEIKSVNEMLEQRVQERTQQLQTINAELAAEISERTKAEEKLKAYTLRLEQSNRELQDFASVASHDMQEPLRKIQAFGDRLKLKCAATLPPEGQDYLERMQNAAQRMQVLINDLLAFSRVTTKAQPFVPVSLSTIVHEVLSDLEVRIQQVNAHIEIGSLPTLAADPLQMRQLLQNLISNALKFHRPEVIPHIQIFSQPCHSEGMTSTISETEEPTFYQIRVADNGIGFDEKYLDRIFTVFQRLHSRSQYEGTGIGLAICRKIVERHSGQITASSQPGQGTTFIITLPTRQHS